LLWTEGSRTEGVTKKGTVDSGEDDASFMTKLVEKGDLTKTAVLGETEYM